MPPTNEAGGMTKMDDNRILSEHYEINVNPERCLLPLGRGNINAGFAASQLGSAQDFDDFIADVGRHFNERRAVEDVDRADGFAGNVALAGDDGDQLAGTQAILLAQPDE